MGDAAATNPAGLTRPFRLTHRDRGEHLYVLQSENGYVKIGRSDDPKKRAAQIQAAQAIDVVLVDFLPQSGPCEPELLRRLAGHRFRGEWTDGTLACREIIEKFFGRVLNWPFVTPGARLTDDQRAVVGAASFLTAKQAAAAIGISVPAFWKQVANERMPAPVYPAPRAPRWKAHEIEAALNATRALPRVALAFRRMTARRARLTPEIRAAEMAQPSRGRSSDG